MSLKVDALHFSYGKSPVLQDIHFENAAGTMLAVLGPNGCGKTTLLRLLAGLLCPQRGSVEWKDENIRTLSHQERAKRISFMSQESVIPRLTVEEFVLLGRIPHFYLRPGEKDRELVRQAMDQCDLGHLRKRKVAEISGGERQRVMLARLLAQGTELLILDEPTSALDISLRGRFLSMIRELTRHTSHTVILSLHDLSDALRYADTCLFLREGRMVSMLPSAAVTETIIEQCYGMKNQIIRWQGIPSVLSLEGDLVVKEGSHA